MKRFLTWLSVVVAVIGCLNAMFITYLKLFYDGACSVGLFQCNGVLASSYASILGFPNSVFGVAGFSLLVYWFYRQAKGSPFAQPIIAFLLSVSALYSLVFLGIQAFVLHQWCPFCVASSVCVGLLTALNISSFFSLKALFSEAKHSFIKTCAAGVMIVGGFVVFQLSLQHALDIKLGRSNVIGTVAGKEYTLAEVDQGIWMYKNRLDEQLNIFRQDWLEARLLEEEATKKGLSLQVLLDQEVAQKALVSDEDIRRVFEQEKPQGYTKTFAEVYPKIKAMLQREKAIQRKKEYVDTLKNLNEFQLHLPVVVKPQNLLNPNEMPIWGPKNSKKTIVLFTDFECEVCNMQYQVIKKIKQDDPTLKVVFRAFNIPRHTRAAGFGAAALCTDEQGQFLTFADLAFSKQDQLLSKGIEAIWGEMSLDRNRFKGCMDEKRGEKRYQTDFQEAYLLGVRATPSMIINGTFYEGFLNEAQLRSILQSF